MAGTRNTKDLILPSQVLTRRLCEFIKYKKGKNKQTSKQHLENMDYVAKLREFLSKVFKDSI